MKKLFIIAIIGWMSVMVADAQIVGFNGGYSFEMNHGIHPNRTSFSIDYMESHGVFGFGTEFPSSYDKRFQLNLHGGLGWYWNDFMLSPLLELAYNTAGAPSEEESVYKAKAGVSVGAGLLAEYKIVGPLGVWTKLRWLSPVGFDPVSFGPGGTTTFAIGLTMYWFR